MFKICQTERNSVAQHNQPNDPQAGSLPPQAYERALTLHRAGRVREAEQFYRAILRVSPNHFGALLHLGLMTSQRGHTQDAERLIRHALAQQPESAVAHNALGACLTMQGRRDEALAEYERSLAIDPRSIESRNNLGNMLHALGRSHDAIAHFNEALALRPDLAELHNNLGNALRAAHREEEAIASFRRAIAIRPDHAETHNNFGVALAACKNYEEAVAEHECAITIKPDYVEAHHNLANALAALGRNDEAISHFERALTLRPNAASTHSSYGNLLATVKRYEDAVRHCLKAIELRPDFFEAHNNLGNALAATERPADAIPHYRKALEINPSYAEAHNNLGNVLGAIERYDEAIACFREALAIDPQLTETYNSLGSALVTVGRIDEGRREMERAIAIAPRQPAYYRGVGECKRYTAKDPHLAAMEALAQDIGSFSDDDRMVLHFALAKAYDDIGRYESAFDHLVEGCKLKRKQIVYNEAATLGLHNRVMEIFTPTLMRTMSGRGDPSAVPVFIIGMPRSGTTLIEQILASHPLVFGAGESLAFHNAVQHLVAPNGPLSQPFPEAVPAMTAQQLRGLGEDYLHQVAALAPQAARITDKALGNFVHVGLIHLALPKARIIHAVRNAMDTCFSCFSKLFASELLYTYDFGELGRYYRSYDSLMRHWHSVLPKGTILEVRYEELVGDLETQARRIVDHCSVDWDERCLAFHQTERPVRTASAVQVRRPIYNSSVERWRPYEAMLRPLRELLEAEEKAETGT
jgi:tetratricopeptide (TPR) repeat protein